jgi:hypothetical protein
VRTRSPLELRARLAPRDTYLHDHVTGTLLTGAYYALLLGIAAYSLILFANLRDGVQAGVAGLLSSWAFVEASGHGHLSRLLPFGAGWFELSGMAVGFAGTGLSITYLARMVLPNGPRMTYALHVSGWVSAACAAVALLAPDVSYLAIVGGIVATSTTGIASATALSRRTVTATYFALAVGAFIVPAMVTGVTLLGVFPAFPENEYAVHGGAMAMSVLLSLLVADSIRGARLRIASLQVASEGRAREVDVLNQELRFQVAARSRAGGRAGAADDALQWHPDPTRRRVREPLPRDSVPRSRGNGQRLRGRAHVRRAAACAQSGDGSHHQR